MCNALFLLFFQPYSTNERKRCYATFRRELFSYYFPHVDKYGPGGYRRPPPEDAAADGDPFQARVAFAPAAGAAPRGAGPPLFPGNQAGPNR